MFHEIVKVRWIAMHFHQEIGLIESADGTTLFIDHGNLRNVGLTHPLKSSEQAVARPNRNYFARFVAMRNQITQAAVRRTMDETLLGHPEIVVHLREIFVPG